MTYFITKNWQKTKIGSLNDENSENLIPQLAEKSVDRS